MKTITKVLLLTLSTAAVQAGDPNHQQFIESPPRPRLSRNKAVREDIGRIMHESANESSVRPLTAHAKPLKRRDTPFPMGACQEDEESTFHFQSEFRKNFYRVHSVERLTSSTNRETKTAEAETPLSAKIFVLTDPFSGESIPVMFVRTPSAGSVDSEAVTPRPLTDSRAMELLISSREQQTMPSVPFSTPQSRPTGGALSAMDPLPIDNLPSIVSDIFNNSGAGATISNRLKAFR